jgi:hypothetical membrane protein
VAFGLASLSLAGVGAFPMNTAPHFHLSAAFFLLGTATLALEGVVRRRWLVAAAVAVGAWVAWAAFGPAAGVTGMALPETVGAVAVAAWALTTAVRGRRPAP